MISYMKDLGIKVTKESSKTHLRRKLQAEFGSLLQFEDLLGYNRAFIIYANLSRLQLAKEVAQLQHLQCEGQASLRGSLPKSGPLDSATKNTFPSFFVGEEALVGVY